MAKNIFTSIILIITLSVHLAKKHQLHYANSEGKLTDIPFWSLWFYSIKNQTIPPLCPAPQDP